ncbi:tetratricopeptide repeat protein [Brevundimonas aurantiaca]|uniref:tetratricopeptide repeat protein n=1 Tax=Brevundimonas aurantiaca TaxID=74316 RepID=UPI001CD2E6AD|nr:tetratricopeptide repeat protein [Brevundimonas aurantiaca]
MTVLFQSENVVARAVPCEDQSRWVITFDNYSIGHGFDREGFSEAYLKAQGLSAVHVMGKREDWYQYPEMPAVLAAVRDAIKDAEHSITYGSSMGGYAALRCADPLGVKAALALSPQYSINPRLAPFEKRWLQDAERLSWSPEGELPLPRKTRAVVVFDPASQDRLHIDLIAAESEIVRIPVRYSGHPSASMLAELHILSPLLHDVLSSRDDLSSYSRLARSGRAKSVTYLVTLAAAAAARRPHWALSLSQRAVDVHPTHIGALQSLASNLHAAGRHDEAVAAYQQAVELSDRNIVVVMPYASMLSEIGRHEEALILAREVSARPDASLMATVQAWRGFLAHEAGFIDEAIEAVAQAAALHPTQPMYQKLLQSYRSQRSFTGKALIALRRMRAKMLRSLSPDAT